MIWSCVTSCNPVISWQNFANMLAKGSTYFPYTLIFLITDFPLLFLCDFACCIDICKYIKTSVSVLTTTTGNEYCDVTRTILASASWWLLESNWFAPLNVMNHFLHNPVNKINYILVKLQSKRYVICCGETFPNPARKTWPFLHIKCIQTYQL